MDVTSGIRLEKDSGFPPAASLLALMKPAAMLWAALWRGPWHGGGEVRETSRQQPERH